MARHIYPKAPKHEKLNNHKISYTSVFVAVISILLLTGFVFLPKASNSANGPLRITLADQTQFQAIPEIQLNEIPASEAAWIGSFLWWINAPDNNNTELTMASWIAHESPWNSSPPDGAMFTWNPINTTLPGFGSTQTVNKVGVRIYPNMQAGIQATVATIEEPRYAVILQNLKWSIGLCGLSYQGLSMWSGNGYSQVC